MYNIQDGNLFDIMMNCCIHYLIKAQKYEKKTCDILFDKVRGIRIILCMYKSTNITRMVSYEITIEECIESLSGVKLFLIYCRKERN